MLGNLNYYCPKHCGVLWKWAVWWTVLFYSGAILKCPDYLIKLKITAISSQHCFIIWQRAENIRTRCHRWTFDSFTSYSLYKRPSAPWWLLAPLQPYIFAPKKGVFMASKTWNISTVGRDFTCRQQVLPVLTGGWDLMNVLLFVVRFLGLCDDLLLYWHCS